MKGEAERGNNIVKEEKVINRDKGGYRFPLEHEVAFWFVSLFVSFSMMCHT